MTAREPSNAKLGRASQTIVATSKMPTSPANKISTETLGTLTHVGWPGGQSDGHDPRAEYDVDRRSDDQRYRCADESELRNQQRAQAQCGDEAHAGRHRFLVQDPQ